MTLQANFRVPFFSVDFDSSRSAKGPAILSYKVLIIGGRLSSGTVAELVLKRVTSEAQARSYWGAGSELHLMFRAFFANNNHTEVYGIALDDAGSGVAATKTLTVTGTATATGSFYVYIGGKRIAVNVTSGDVQNSVAAAINTAIGATADLPMSSTVATNVVTLLSRQDGESGNSIDVRLNYGEGEAFPAGISVAVAAGTSGANNPDIQDVLDVIGDEWYQIIIAPYSDATNLSAIEAELDSRFGGLRQIPGQYICSKSANLATMSSFGDGRNSKHVRAIDAYGIPWTVAELAAAWGALEASSASLDPARPIFRQVINGLGAKPPAIADRRTLEEMNSLLFDGISTISVVGSNIQIGRAITMYQKNSANADDSAYLRAETMYTLMYYQYSFNQWFLTRYPRAKLADDGVRVAAGQSVITPAIAKSEAVAWARAMENLGLLENVEQFKEDLEVVRPNTDADRLNFTLSPDTVNQLVVGSADMFFII